MSYMIVVQENSEQYIDSYVIVVSAPLRREARKLKETEGRLDIWSDDRTMDFLFCSHATVVLYGPFWILISNK